MVRRLGRREIAVTGTEHTLRRLDREILAIIALVWGAHFAILAARSAAMDVWAGAVPMAIRFSASVVGALTTLAIHAVLKQRTMGPARRFAAALVLSAPLCALLAGATQLTWLVTTGYFQEKYGLRIEDIFEKGRPFAIETIHTATAFFWVYVAWAALYAGAVRAAKPLNREPVAPQASVRPPTDRHLWVRNPDGLVRLPIESIEFIEAAGDYVVAHAGANTHVLSEMLGSIEDRVDPTSLIRVHRSAMVNLAQVRSLRRRGRRGLSLILQSGREVAIGPSYTETVFAAVKARRWR
jgi:LytTr DNA-binding domain